MASSPTRGSLSRPTTSASSGSAAFSQLLVHTAAAAIAAAAAAEKPGTGKPLTATTDPEDTSAADGKVWVRLIGADGEESRMKVVPTLTTIELRKIIRTKIGVPGRELDLYIGGDHLFEGPAQPLLNAVSGEDLVIRWERMDRLQSLMRYRKLADMNSVGKYDRTLLHFAVLDGDPDLCKSVVDHRKFDRGTMDFQDVFRDTPLMLASILGYEEIVITLIDRQATLNQQNLCGRTAVQMAAEHGHTAVVKVLLEEGADTGTGPKFVGTMGRWMTSKTPEYLAELNLRESTIHRIRIHKLSKKTKLQRIRD